MKLIFAVGPLVLAIALAIGGGVLLQKFASGEFSSQHAAQNIADAKAAELGYVPESINKSIVVDGKRYRFAYKSGDGRTCYIYVDGGQIKPRDVVEW